MSLFTFARWCDQSAIGQALRGSAWAFSVIEAVHLLALALLGGMVLLVDFRLFGLGLKRQPVFELAREVEPYLVGGLIAMLASGFLLFMSEAMKCYQSLPFRIKIVFLFPAIVYTFTIRRRVTLEDVPAASARNKIVALVSIFLWSMVGIMGRAVAFY